MVVLIALACAPAPRETAPTAPEPRIDPTPASRPPVRVPPPEEPVERLAPPEVAYARGWMPLASTAADRFVREHPTKDGRGVLIAILDTGVDPGVPGLRSTSTGDPKLVDVRDFSDEGVVALARVSPRGDTVEIAGRKLGGFGRVVALNTTGPYYAGTLRELSLGEPPASDLDASGEAVDTLALVVTRATDGWVVLADTDGDGSLAGERPVRDYLLGRETFGWAPPGRTPRANLAANFTERGGEPLLGLVVALDSHGTHVAGIAGAHDLYGARGFDGVAPGAQLLGLKISNRAHGSVSTSGAILSAMDYAIRFAAARRQPLVINLSFGVGNEREGAARIDGLVDSVLAEHPRIVLTVSAGNDGPGLSTVGIPGSARRAISVGGTIPPVFLPPGPGGAVTEIVADFSARGGEVARPDVIAPAVAYSSVPLWNAGDEVKQGTSMAAPHVAGLAALLLSSFAPEQRPTARALRQALMVTARPSPGGGYLDEGRGLPDVEAAYRWLLGGGTAPGIEVAVPGTGTTGGWVVAGSRGGGTGVQRFQLRRQSAGAPVTYALRSDVPWLTGPPTVTLAGETTAVELRYAADRLPAPGAHTGVVSGWPSDTLAGPAFRLVTTVVVPAAVADTAIALRRGEPVAPGEALRSFFAADSARPFEVRVSSSPGQRGLAYLHEPGGAPYREAGTRPLGGAGGAVYRVDARDAVRGEYQAVGSAVPGAPISLSAVVVHAPFTIADAVRTGDVASAELSNVTADAVSTGVELRLRGAQRRDTTRASGSAVQRIPFDIPPWATGLEVDVAMDRAQWGRFTDFGVTVFDSVGRQIAQDPLEYSFGRLSTVLPPGHGGIRAELTLLPGFADSTDQRPWSATATFRLYADSAVAVAPLEGSAASIAPGQRASVRFRLPAEPWPLPAGFAPLGVILAREGEQVWTRETDFPERSAR